MKYRVVFSSRAFKEIKRFTLPVRERISDAAGALADNPRPRGCLKMQGADSYRIRIGDYRIVYEIHDRIVTVLVLEVGHRKDIYR
jgi:mRNA interferase RelE/StbE